MQSVISEGKVVSDDVMPERFCDYYISGQGELPMNEQLNVEQNFLQVQRDIARERSMQDMLKRGNDASQQALRNSQLQKNMYNLNKF
jgi:hypothetical protein